MVDQLLAAAARARASGAMVQAAGFYKQILDRHPGHRLASYNAGIILENAAIVGELFGGYEQPMQRVMLLDHGWQEVAQTALDFVKRFVPAKPS